MAARPAGADGEKAVQKARGDVEELLKWFVDRHYEREEWAAAIRHQEELADFEEHLHGKDDYRATDARRDVGYLELLKKLPPDDARQLIKAGHLIEKADGLKEAGKAAEAIPLVEEALTIRNRFLRDNDARTAKWLNFLGQLQKYQGNYARAETLYGETLAIRKKILGENHPDYAVSLHNLAGVYREKGEYARAEPLLRQALEIEKKALGENHCYYAGTLNSLALLYEVEGDYARAEPLYRQALEIRKKVLGENHPDYAESLNNLAALYEAQGDYVAGRAAVSPGLGDPEEGPGREPPRLCPQPKQSGRAV